MSPGRSPFHPRETAWCMSTPIQYCTCGVFFCLDSREALGPPARFIPSTSSENYPQYSPDGKRVAFAGPTELGNWAHGSAMRRAPI